MIRSRIASFRLVGKSTSGFDDDIGLFTVVNHHLKFAISSLIFVMMLANLSGSA